MKYVVRTLTKRPGFTAAVLLTLGLGIAANTAIFSVVNGVLLQPLPFEAPEQLVTPDVMSTQGFYISTSIPNYYDWKDQSRSFDTFGAYRGASAVLTGLDRPEVVQTRQVIGDFFEVLGVEAAMGRTISAQEAEPGAAAIAVLSHRFWRDQLGGDPRALGRTLILDEAPFEVVGVMPDGFVFPSPDDDIYLPMGYFAENLNWGARGSSSGTRAVARLLPGVSIELAQTDLDRVTASIRETEDETAAAPILVSLTERYVGEARAPLWTMMGAVAFVLLIACANVANLLLARGEGRQKELALRAALGAKRNRVVRQLLTESLVLGLAGGLLGITLAFVALSAMKSALPASLPGLVAGRVSIDPTVLGFTLALSVLTGLIFGFMPALRSSSPDLVSTLKEGGRSGAGTAGHRMRATLVVAEVALSLVLLAGAGLLIKSLDSLHQVDKGFDETNVLTLNIPLSSAKYPEEEVWRGFNRELLERIGSIPGVEEAALASFVPLGGSGWETSILPEGVDPNDRDNYHSVLNTIASVGFHDALGIQIVRGRGFTPADDANGPPVIVIDETMAEKFWPGQDPIGKRVTMEFARFVAPGSADNVPIYRTVVGVAEHVRHYELQEPSRIEAYRPLDQSGRTWGFSPTLVVKSAGDPARLVQSIRREITSMDADQPVQFVRTMAEVVESQLATFTAMRGALVLFGALALILAAIGIYGVMSYSVAQRVREVGIRMALGAQAHEVRWLISRGGLKLAVLGLGLGTIGALAMTRSLQSLLFGIDATEPVTLIAVSGVLMGVAFLAAYIPARRATRIDPAVVLREE